MQVPESYGDPAPPASVAAMSGHRGRRAVAFFRMYLAAFLDLRMDPEDVIASGCKVVARVRECH